jgi:hypothetical protein
MTGEEAIEGVLVTFLRGGRRAVVANDGGDLNPADIAELEVSVEIEPMKTTGELFGKMEPNYPSITASKSSIRIREPS